MNEREIILEALLLYNQKKEYGDKIISDILSKYAYLDKEKRSFINRLFDGVIEREITLDYIINLFSTVKVNKQKPVIRMILRMGVYQIFYMDQVPDFATINEAVKLAKRKKFVNLAGFINGVLRNVSKNKDNIEFTSKEKDPVKYLSVVYSCPEWLVKHFADEVKFTSDSKNEKISRNEIYEKVEKILSASLEKQTLYGRVNLSKASREEVIESLKNQDVKADVVSELDCAIMLNGIDNLNDLDAFSDGLFVIQDLSSQKVIGKLNVSKDNSSSENLNGLTVVDVCSSPGGKTLHALDRGAKVIARDVSEYKAERIVDNIEKCGFSNAIVEVKDALVLDETLIGKADVVIADLPCSGLGVIGRKTDIKYRVTEDDLLSLRNLQRDILKVVSQYVKTGGILVYSTCTVDHLENEDNALWISENLPFEKAYETEKMIQGINNSDGFFISRFIKK